MRKSRPKPEVRVDVKVDVAAVLHELVSLAFFLYLLKPLG